MRRGHRPFAGWRASPCILSLLLIQPGCTRRDTVFNEDNARAHLNRLAGAIGSRWIGTDQNRQAREYLVDQLALYGFDVRVQDVEAVRPELGRTARVANIIALKPGTLAPDQGAIALTAHYDSRPDTPGAGDDAFGTAVSVEAARVLAAGPHRHALMVVITDGEEAGLMGAAAFVTEPAFGQIRALLHVEAIGSAGPAVLFQVSPGGDWLLGPWRRAPRPRGASYAIEIYRRLPQDTDFTIYQAAGAPGLNFAAAGESFAYHTARDRPDRVPADLLRQTGQTLVAIARELDALDLPRPTARAPGSPAGRLLFGKQADSVRSDPASAESTYFSLLEQRAISYSRVTTHVLGVFAIVAGFVAWARIIRGAARTLGLRVLLMTVVWSLAGLAIVTAAMVGATWGVRHARAVYHPWYGHPLRFGLFLLVSASAAGWLTREAGRLLPALFRGSTHPVLVWVVALPVWIGLAAFTSIKAPTAAFLWTLPLGTAGLLLAVAGNRSAAWIRGASVVVLLVSAALWLQDAPVIFSFAVAALGREPLVTPAFVYPALILLVSHMVAPPVLATVWGWNAPPRHAPAITSVLLFAFVVSAGLVYAAPAYTHERSLRRQVRYVAETAGGRAWWEVAANEPGLDLPAGRGAPENWSPAAEAPTRFLQALEGPFVFRASADPHPPPARVHRDVVRVEGGIRLEVSVVPAEPGLIVTFVLPPRLVPEEATLAGTVRRGRWRAAYVAPPLDGITFQARLSAVTPDVLRDAAVLIQSTGFPGGQGWQRLPPWLPQDRMVWSGWAYWVVPMVP